MELARGIISTVETSRVWLMALARWLIAHPADELLCPLKSEKVSVVELSRVLI